MKDDDRPNAPHTMQHPLRRRTPISIKITRPPPPRNAKRPPRFLHKIHPYVRMYVSSSILTPTRPLPRSQMPDNLIPAIRLPIIQQPPDLLETNRLSHKKIDPTGKRLALVATGRQPRESDDQSGRRQGDAGGRGLVTLCFDIADGAGGFEAVHDGHGDV